MSGRAKGLSKFEQNYLIFPLKSLESLLFLMMSEEIEVKQFAQIRQILRSRT